MSKYAEAIKEAQFQIANAHVFLESEDYKNEPAIQWSAKRKLRDFTVYLEALQIADRLEQTEEELKDEYNSMNDWYMNKFDIFQDHTECEKIALNFTLSTMQTISYLLDSLADIRGEENGK